MEKLKQSQLIEKYSFFKSKRLMSKKAKIINCIFAAMTPFLLFPSILIGEKLGDKLWEKMLNDLDQVVEQDSNYKNSNHSQKNLKLLNYFLNAEIGKRSEVIEKELKDYQVLIAPFSPLNGLIINDKVKLHFFIKENETSLIFDKLDITNANELVSQLQKLQNKDAIHNIKSTVFDNYVILEITKKKRL